MNEYLLTAIGLTRGGSSTVHIHTNITFEDTIVQATRLEQQRGKDSGGLVCA